VFQEDKWKLCLQRDICRDIANCYSIDFVLISIDNCGFPEPTKPNPFGLNLLQIGSLAWDVACNSTFTIQLIEASL
jgi:hypothetical protein